MKFLRSCTKFGSLCSHFSRSFSSSNLFDKEIIKSLGNFSESINHHCLINACQTAYSRRVYSPELVNLVFLRLKTDPSFSSFSNIKDFLMLTSLFSHMQKDDLLLISEIVEKHLTSNLAEKQNYPDILLIVRCLVISGIYSEFLMEFISKKCFLDSIPDEQLNVRALGIIRDGLIIEQGSKYNFTVAQLDSYLRNFRSFKRFEIEDMLKMWPDGLTVDSRFFLKIYLAIKDLYPIQAFASNIFTFTSRPEILISHMRLTEGRLRDKKIDLKSRYNSCDVAIISWRSAPTTGFFVRNSTRLKGTMDHGKAWWKGKVTLLESHFQCEFDLENGAVFLQPFRYYLAKHNWVKLTINGRSRLVRLCPLPPVILDQISEEKDEVFMSSLLNFNMLGNDIHRCNSDLSAEIYEASEPPLADEVHLAVINSPDYSSLGESFQAFTSLARDFFSKERVVRQGDVISIPSYLNADFYALNDEYSIINWPCINFCLQKLPTNNQEYRTSSKTKVYIFGSIQSAVPYSACEFFSQRPSIPVPNTYLSPLFEAASPYFGSFRRKVGRILLSGASGSGKLLTCKKLACKLNVNLYIIECHEILGENPLNSAKTLRSQMCKALNYGPCLVYLRQIDLLCLDKEDTCMGQSFKSSLNVLGQRDKNQKFGMVVIGSTSRAESVIESSLAPFDHHIDLKPPNKDDRIELLNYFLRDTPESEKTISQIVQLTSGFSLNDLMFLLISSKKESLNSADKAINYESKIREMNRSYARSLGAPRVPDVKWSDIGGLVEAKKEILDCIQRPNNYPQLKDPMLRRCGFLLYGPPGTGKTLLAKAVASQCSFNFLSVKGPELISAYVGQSEENIRHVFTRAVKARPSVIFFDELDSLAPKRGKFGDSAGVMDRVVSQLTCEMDEVSRCDDIFVFGATNRPDLLDPALLRPGRFDRWVYVGPPTTKEDRMSVLKALTNKFVLEKDLILDDIESKLPASLTGADFYSICSSAMLNALKRCVEIIEKDENQPSDLVVTMQDFEDVLRDFVPSVKPDELFRYESIRKEMIR